MARMSWWTLAVGAPANLFARDVREPAFDTKCRLRDAGVRMRSVVVQDEMDLRVHEFRNSWAVDSSRSRFGTFRCSNTGRRAVAHVMVRNQRRLQCLDLALLVDTQLRSGTTPPRR